MLAVHEAGDRVEVTTETGAWTAGAVIVASGGPAAAIGLLGSDPGWDDLGDPVTAACLDLGLSRPGERPVLFGFTEPLYLSTHCPPADLAPEGGAVVQVMRYGARDAATDRDTLTSSPRPPASRPTPSSSSASSPTCTSHGRCPTAAHGGLRGRPDARVPRHERVFVAGDWVGPVGMLGGRSDRERRSGGTPRPCRASSRRRGTLRRVEDDVQAVDVFEAERPRLLGLAYRILGSAVDAEDVVQEAWVRWQAATGIERPAAWLTTVVSRLALDAWRAQQRKREDYVGPWLPEPVATEADPAERAEMADSLTFGFLVLLDELTAVERVVFLLADVFGESFADISATVGKTEAACRQIASRARRKLQQSKPHRPEERLALPGARVAHRSLAGDVAATMALLDPDVVLTSDGGPHRHAARRPVIGADRVTRLLVNITQRGLDETPRCSSPR